MNTSILAAKALKNLARISRVKSAGQTGPQQWRAQSEWATRNALLLSVCTGEHCWPLEGEHIHITGWYPVCLPRCNFTLTLSLIVFYIFTMTLLTYSVYTPASACGHHGACMKVRGQLGALVFPFNDGGFRSNSGCWAGYQVPLRVEPPHHSFKFKI